MFRSIFLEDVVRLYRAGLLPGACVRLATRPAMGVAYACFAAAFLFIPSEPLTAALLIFLALMMTCVHVGDSVVNFMTPLCFGSFLIGRLKRRWIIRARYITYRAEFILVPSGAEILLTNVTIGTEGQTYLLLQHPAAESVVLAVIDDSPWFMKSLERYATEARWSEITAQIEKLRRTDS
jgi:hypothetical protein